MERISRHIGTVNRDGSNISTRGKREKDRSNVHRPPTGSCVRDDVVIVPVPVHVPADAAVKPLMEEPAGRLAGLVWMRA